MRLWEQAVENNILRLIKSEKSPACSAEKIRKYVQGLIHDAIMSYDRNGKDVAYSERGIDVGAVRLEI